MAGVSNHAFAVKQDGTLWGGVGENFATQCGKNGTTDITTLITAYGATGFPSPIKKIALGAGHTLVLLSNGQVYGVGQNSSRELGTGNITARTTFGLVVGGALFTDIESAGSTCMGLKADGTIWAWGFNGSGQMGQGDILAKTTPLQVGTGTDWAFIACGDNAMFAIKEDGSLWSWGLNSTYRLGTPFSTSNCTSPRMVDAGPWRAVSAGGVVVMGIKADGTLWGCGTNQQEQITPSSYFGNQIASFIQIGEYSDWKWVESNAYITAGLRADGTLWTWGNNNNGLIGRGVTDGLKYTVEQLGEDSDWEQLFLGQYDAYAKKYNGTLWSWGWNNVGQLGIGGVVVQNAPKQVTTHTDFLGWSGTTLPPRERYLIVHEGAIKKHNGSAWVDTLLTEPLAESDYLAHGMNHLGNLTEAQIAELGTMYEVLKWTESTTGTSDLFLYTEPTSLIEKLNNPEVYIYTTDTGTFRFEIEGQPIPKFRYRVELLDPATVLYDWSDYYSADMSTTITIEAKHINQSLNPYTIRVYAQPEGSSSLAVYQDLTLELTNTAPTIEISMTGMLVEAVLGDAEADQIQYRVVLNNTQIFPKVSDGEYTEAQIAPVNYRKTFKSTDVNLGAPNTLEVYLRDEFGEVADLEYVFQGDYTGLMFSDELGLYYTSDLGELIQYLDFGILVAGQNSIAAKVTLTNKFPFPVTNIQIDLSQGDLPSDVVVYVDTEEAFSDPQQTLAVPGTLSYNGTSEFWVRISSENTAQAGGTFEVHTSADPA